MPVYTYSNPNIISKIPDTLSPMNFNTDSHPSGAAINNDYALRRIEEREDDIILSPRPYERHSGKLLIVPLLPRRRTFNLPCEVWEKIFRFVLMNERLMQHSGYTSGTMDSMGWRMVRVCRNFKDIALPLIYENVSLRTMLSFHRFYSRLYDADQHWDSIRRIPYSAPGRWVQSLNLSRCRTEHDHQDGTAVYQSSLDIDTLLTKSCPLTPFLHELVLDPYTHRLSKRAWQALQGLASLTVLKGIAWHREDEFDKPGEGLIGFLRACPLVESLEVVGFGLDNDLDDQLQHLDIAISTLNIPSAPPPDSASSSYTSIELPNLHTLTILLSPISRLLTALLHASLPSLTTLALTPYNDVPAPLAITSTFLQSHGHELKKLILCTPKELGRRNRECMSLEDVLNCCPRLRWLEFEPPFSNPTPSTSYISASSSSPTRPAMITSYPLHLLTLPRPNLSFLLHTLQPLRSQGRLDNLQVVRMRDVKWLKKSYSRAAGETGVQGEMKDWRRRLSGRHYQFGNGFGMRAKPVLKFSGVVVVDAEWNDGE